jgi:hypothetical protein
MYTFALCNFEKRKEEKGRKEGRNYRTFVCYEINTIPYRQGSGIANNNKQMYGNIYSI